MLEPLRDPTSEELSQSNQGSSGKMRSEGQGWDEEKTRESPERAPAAAWGLPREGGGIKQAGERRWKWGRAFQAEGTALVKVLSQKSSVRPIVKYQDLLNSQFSWNPY